MIHNVKSSTAFLEIEHALSGIAEDIKILRINCEGNLASIAEKRKIGELEIQQFRRKIDAHLDKLQDHILKEIKAVEEKKSSQIRELLTSIMQKETETLGIKINFQNTKRYASDLQTFFAIKHIEKDITKENNYIQLISKSEQMHQIDISCRINTALKEFIATVTTFGEVLISSNSLNISIENKWNKQAQISLPPSRTIFDNVSLKLKQTIQTNWQAVRGCTFLPDGKMVFSTISTQLARVLKPDGSSEFDLNNIGPVWDVVYTGDNDVATTSGNKNQIKIIDVEKRKVKKTLNVNSANNGVTIKNEKLIYCARDQGLKMISLSDESITTISTSNMSFQAYVNTQGDKLFYSNEENHNVTCINFQGKTLWTFNESSTLKYPFGISVDNDGNVFVAGTHSHNLIVISSDGRRYRQLLSKKDGLDSPTVVEYDQSNNKLLVANNFGNTFVYEVV
ncbi:uncharacterized protein LOC134727931 [Mytilus trossulus]|uniref:uncharacterized protein LOC134727931 n=1 Tax=Mytilus trossulus TaxID=6551 RepID=UPI0030056A43